MTIEDWLASACADADRRGLPDLDPLLVSLAEATRALRTTGWDDAAPAKPSTPAAPDPGAPR